MKKYIISILITILLFSGCSDTLDENPKSIAEETFYNTLEEVKTAVNSIYLPLHDTEGSFAGVYLALLEAHTDYSYSRGTYGSAGQYTGLDNTAITRVGLVWTRKYEAIRNANICIKKIPGSTELTETQKTEFIAEARFLRGLSYMHLVQNFAGVPIRKVENMSDKNLAKSSVADVWKFIIEDLEYAETNLPDKARMQGAPYKFAAKAMLVEAKLHVKDYEKARSLANEIMTSGLFSLIEVSAADDFDSKLYGPLVTSSSEEIFYMKFTNVSSKGFVLPMFYHHPGAGYIGRNRGWYPIFSDFETNLVLKNWDKQDLRFEYNWYAWDAGLSANTAFNKKYQDKDAISNYSIRNDYPMYRYADILLYFAEAEARQNGITTEAIEALNKVHRRGYGMLSTQPSTIDFKTSDFSDVTDFIETIVKERCYETIFEGKRWNDLKRLGMAKQAVKDAKGIDVADKALLWPIPELETNYNEAVDPVSDQNPGY